MFGADALAERWGVSRQYVLDMVDARGLAAPTPVGRARGTGTFAWSRRQVEAFEAANLEWCSPEAVEERRAKRQGKTQRGRSD